MGYSGWSLCAKYSLFVANFVLFIGGAILLGLGIWTLVDKNFVNELLGTNLFSGAVYTLIVTSTFVCLISFFGCMGAAKEVKCMLLTYFVLVLLIFVVTLIGGILGYVFRAKVSNSMHQEMISSLSQYGNRRAVTLAWDETQTRLRCCGVNDWRDWYGVIPESCCQEAYGGTRKPCTQAPSALTIHSRGCREVATEFIQQHASILGGAGITVAILQLFALIFSCILFNTIE